MQQDLLYQIGIGDPRGDEAAAVLNDDALLVHRLRHAGEWIAHEAPQELGEWQRTGRSRHRRRIEGFTGSWRSNRGCHGFLPRAKASSLWQCRNALHSPRSWPAGEALSERRMSGHERARFTGALHISDWRLFLARVRPRTIQCGQGEGNGGLRYLFEDFVLDSERRELRHGAGAVP